VHETELMEPLGKAELHRTFFNHLDAQLNKINRFYKLKETEYIAQARRLERQLLALFEVQEALLAGQSSLLSLQSSSKNTDINSRSYCDDESFGGKFDYCMHANVQSSSQKKKKKKKKKKRSCTQKLELTLSRIDIKDMCRNGLQMYWKPSQRDCCIEAWRSIQT
jgi:hypothetical protein